MPTSACGSAALRKITVVPRTPDPAEISRRLLFHHVVLISHGADAGV